MVIFLVIQWAPLMLFHIQWYCRSCSNIQALAASSTLGGFCSTPSVFLSLINAFFPALIYFTTSPLQSALERLGTRNWGKRWVPPLRSNNGTFSDRSKSPPILLYRGTIYVIKIEPPVRIECITTTTMILELFCIKLTSDYGYGLIFIFSHTSGSLLLLSPPPLAWYSSRDCSARCPWKPSLDRPLLLILLWRLLQWSLGSLLRSLL